MTRLLDIFAKMCILWYYGIRRSGDHIIMGKEENATISSLISLKFAHLIIQLALACG